MVRTDLLGRLGRRLRLEAMSIGDARKSWDVLLTAQLLEQHLSKADPVVDFGAYHSEITGTLCRLGFSHLTGVDLNPRLTRGPYPHQIRYLVRDFLDSGLPSASCAAITSISAIEHGHSTDRLLDEVGRVLKPGGYLVGSTDYWPEQIATSGVSIFGMDSPIFSAAEMAALFAAAESRGLRPVGPLAYGAQTPAVHFAGRDYTFAWFALRKQPA